MRRKDRHYGLKSQSRWIDNFQLLVSILSTESTHSSLLSSNPSCTSDTSVSTHVEEAGPAQSIRFNRELCGLFRTV